MEKRVAAVKMRDITKTFGPVVANDHAKLTIYKGETLTTYTADVDDMGDFVPETEVIADGYFHESEYRSAPYFDMFIDGITNLDA